MTQFFGHEMDSGSQIAVVHQQDECYALNCEFHSTASLSGVCGEFWTSGQQYGVLDYCSDYAYPQLFDECGWPVFCILRDYDNV